MVVYTFVMNKCVICGKSTESNSPTALYCPRCRKLKHKALKRKIYAEVSKKALKDAWKGDGFYCHYCKHKLEEKNSKSPYYITFDHVIPQQNNNIVMAAAIINDMKSDMDEAEFRKMVISLANCFNGGTFDPSTMNLKYYRRRKKE
jgi:DNA-directed RNA polymerase subunit RPC12/RpoP